MKNTSHKKAIAAFLFATLALSPFIFRSHAAPTLTSYVYFDPFIAPKFGTYDLILPGRGDVVMPVELPEGLTYSVIGDDTVSANTIRISNPTKLQIEVGETRWRIVVLQ